MKSKTARKAGPATKLVTAFDYTAINAALEQLLDPTWTETNQQAIKREVGTGNYLKIREIISFVLNQDAWLDDYSISSLLPLTKWAES